MREIKFRAWRVLREKMVEWEKLKTMYTIHGLFDYPDVVTMQYTGLKDSNGKEIYEGDILLVFSTGDYYEVVWDSTGAMFLFANTDDAKGKLGADDYYDFEDEHKSCGFEVVGNRFENPELIGGKKVEQVQRKEDGCR